MADRLQELLHQKALLSEHSAWLDREIAIERSRSPAPQPPIAAAATPAPAPLPQAPATKLPAVSETESVLDTYRQEPKDIRRNVTRGCLLFFFAGLILFGIGVAAVYFFYGRK